MIVSDEIDEVWKDDALSRREDARYLQNYLAGRYQSKPEEPGFVLAINADWGFGKSFMLDRWRKEAALLGYPSIYFDAWKNDFTSDPLLAFISELERGLAEYIKSAPIEIAIKEKIKNTLKKIWRPALTIIASTAAKHALGMSLDSLISTINDSSGEDADEKENDKIFEVFKDGSEKLYERVEKTLEIHQTVKESIENFKNNLSNLIKYLESVHDVNLPLLIFVDELDRCRPNYAIELLEGIKHLFGVAGVTFVVATNIGQLSESIKAVYGPGFDGQRYLQRFFDLQFTLSEPNNESYSRLMLGKIVLPDSINLIYGLEHDSVVHPPSDEDYNSIDYASVVLAKHADAFGLSLRDIHQVTTILEAAFITLKSKKIHIFFLVFLAVVYQKNYSVFRKLSVHRSLSDPSGIPTLISKGNAGDIKFSAIDDYGHRRDNSKISMLRIAEIYFSKLEVSSLEELYSEEFPNRNIDQNHFFRKGRMHVADFSNYFQIIGQAGGFINKN